MNLINILKRGFISLLIILFSTFLMLSCVEVTMYALSQLNPIPGVLRPLNKSLYFDKWFHDFSERIECREYSRTRLYDLAKESSCPFINVEFSTIVTLDANGARINKDRDLPKVNPIIAIGDSVTMGWGVKNDQTYSSILEGLLQARTINLGVNSYNTSRELDKLLNFPDYKDANTIIIQYHENDYPENTYYIEKGPKFYTKEDFNSRQDAINQTYSWHTGGYQFFDYTLKLFQLSIKHIFNSTSVAESPRNLNLEAKIFFKILEKHQTLRHKRIIVFDGSELDRQHSDFQNIFSKAAETFGFKNVEVVDMQFSHQDYFRLDNHQNTLGHQKIARKIFEVINRLE
jgi:hypothetical protein